MELVNHPKHYNAHPSGIEAIVIMRWLPCNLALAVKHVWRRHEKSALVLDLEKACWYLTDEMRRYDLGERIVIHRWDELTDHIIRVCRHEEPDSPLEVLLRQISKAVDLVQAERPDMALYENTLEVALARLERELEKLQKEPEAK